MVVLEWERGGERERELVKKSVANIHDFISGFLVGERELGKERWVEVG